MAASVTQVLTGLSSMATRRLLSDLAEEIGRRQGIGLRFESAGGVEIAERIRAGARADLVVLAADALEGLADEGLVVPGSVRPLFLSSVVAAVPGGNGRPLQTEDQLRALMLESGRVAYSTGPSGTALLALVQRWGLADEMASRWVQAPPGVPVGSLLADGAADLGFQQLSELADVTGITVLGPLPGDAAVRSTFSGGVLSSSGQPEAAEGALDALGGAELAPLVRAAGMDAATPT